MAHEFLKNLFGSKIEDESLETQLKDVAALSTYMAAMFPGSPPINEARNEIINASGSFGHSETNPIPVNGPTGECVYLQRLRAKSGVGCFFHRIGSSPATVKGQAIDVFEVVACDASQWATLYFLMYFPRRSLKCPDGFFLKSWSSMHDVEKISCRLPGFGSFSRVENFPLGLPEAVENSSKLNSAVPGAGASFARKIREMLNKQEGKWHRTL